MSYVILLSPAKKQDFANPPFALPCSSIAFPAQTTELVTALKKLSTKQLAATLGVSDKLAVLNAERYAQYDCKRYTKSNAHPALYTFQGDAYKAMDAMTLGEQDIAFIQDHLRILSGLYGLLRPLDKIQYHRLEMGRALDNSAGKDLYAFWRDRVTQQLSKDASKTNVIINCASGEYTKAVNKALFPGRWIDVVFRQKRDGKYKTIGILAKRARGQMVRFAAKKRYKKPESLQQFDTDGYAFDAEQSTDSCWVFLNDTV